MLQEKDTGKIPRRDGLPDAGDGDNEPQDVQKNKAVDIPFKKSEADCAVVCETGVQSYYNV